MSCADAESKPVHAIECQGGAHFKRSVSSATARDAALAGDLPEDIRAARSTGGSSTMRGD